MQWLIALTRLAREGKPGVLITVTAARGSTPREAGAKMTVSAETCFDRIGGGALELACVGIARDLLRDPAGPVTREFPLGPALGQCCGGHVSVLFEPISPPMRRVALFGAGHVDKALVQVLTGTRTALIWIDSRAEALTDAPDWTDPRLAPDPAAEVASLPMGTIVLVMTHDHQMDFQIVTAALARTDFAAIGLIGSETKRARFAARLARLGLDANRLICPIGLPGLNAKPPAEIAISVAAQILGLDRAAPMVKKAIVPSCRACLEATA